MNTSTYSDNQRNWKVPETEVMNRTFNEGARFFLGRQHGVKKVYPPKAEYLSQLVEEMAETKPNLLLDGRYARSRVGNRDRATSQIATDNDRVIEDTKSIISQIRS